MDSHSRSASPREPSRPQHRPPSPPAGFDNRAYHHDESDPNHNDSFASQPHQNGHTKENGDTKLEAVNLELINLTPKNGNAKKKDVEVDMNATNPYDEYFVPVNEHRKYMRGEKLYVTADKRGEKGGCKRPLCWTLLGLVVAAIVALIVLAATGILFSNSPTPLEPYNTSVSSARALGGIGQVHNHNHDHDHDHDHHDHDHDHHDHDHDHDHHDHTTQIPTTTETQKEENIIPNMSEEPGDMSVYVPKTVEGELRIDNKDFVSALEDPESEEYKEFTSTFTDALKRALFNRNTIDNGDNEIIVEVVGIKEGSIIVTYRVHWKPRANAEPNEDLLTANTLKSTLNNYLDNNNRMISVYHIAEDKMATRPVLDLCKISNNDCEYGCEFDDTTLDFTCTCPHGQIQDMRSPKKCIHILDNPDQEHHTENHTEKELKVLTLDETDKMRAIPEEEKPDMQTVHMADDETAFDWKEPYHVTAEATTENDEDVNYSHIFGHPRSRNDDIEAEPEPTSEPKPEPAPTAEPKPEPEPTAEPKPEPEPTAEPKPEPTAEPKPEPNSEPKPEPTAEPKPEPEPTAEPKPEPSAEPKPEPEPTAEPKPEPTAEPKPGIDPTTKSKLEPTAEPKPEPEPTAEPKPEPAPTALPEPESTSVLEGITELKTEPSSEPKPLPEPEPSPETEPSREQNSNTTPQSEPTVNHNYDSTQTSEPTVVSVLHSESSKEFNLEPETKIEPEPASEPNLTVIASDEKLKNEMESKLTIASNEEKEASHIPQTFMESARTNAEPSESQDDARPEYKMEPITQDVIIPNMPVTTQSSSNEEFEQQTAEHINNENISSNLEPVDKFNDLNVSGETTTARISISEPNIINEPSYEPKPEIVSILREHNEMNNETLFSLTDDGDDDYLSNDEDSKNQAQGSIDIYSKTADDQITATEVTSILNNDENKTEQRSSKNLNPELSVETSTTIDTVKGKDDVTFELLTKNEEKLGENTSKIRDEIPVTTTTIEKMSEPTENPSFATTTKAESSREDNSETIDNLNTQFTGISMKDQEKAITTTPEVPTMDVQTDNEYSINQQIQDSVENKNLMEVLENKNESDTHLHTTTTESHNHDENDVTFDVINMLYNRTSKSIENNGVQETTESVATTDSTDTTDSDWLFETVTEVNYKDAMSKMESHDTTETTISKIDEVMNRGVSKDDFEPDYLNMGSNASKMPEQDEPLYGMIHDYDNDDLRETKINTKRKQPEATDTNNNINDSKETFESASNAPVVENTNVTTVTHYIYKLSENFQNTSLSYDEHSSDEKDKDDMSPESTSEAKLSSANVSDDAIAIPTTTTATTMISIGENQDANIATEITTDDSQNSTRVNNLNVTIYEIPKHSGNQSHSTPNHTHSQSAEYEDHETEMNPFLPEAENNKILVKKLQEGHDLEPVNLNETQNENIEDHISANVSSTNATQSNNYINSSNFTILSMDATESFTSPSVSKATEENSVIYEPQAGSNSQSTENTSSGTTDDVKISPLMINEETTEMPKSVNAENVLPISTFLLDTDDLDVPKQNSVKNYVPSAPIEEPTSTPKIETENDDSEYLSVVPIEQETHQGKEALKNYDSENIQELNYISDSPKKSDRRTLDTTNLESIINNEA